MTKTLPIMEVRKQLTSLPESLVQNGQIDVVEVTRRGKPVLAVMPWELYEAVLETLEIMGDPELTSQLRESVEELKAGDLVPWQAAKLELGI